ncbi:MAG TPA: hypothetical protein VJ793_20855 [Anaerolineae bacterium]|nr:hypothetical protein [Anaerolineae bacterium]
MTTLTLELPESLVERLRERRISEQEIQTVAVAALEFWLANAGQIEKPATPAAGRFAASGASFARRLIQQNRALFKTFAQR